ncbi:MAG TPA: transposase [Arenibacter sp.]|nr:transposase [Arenibacter sp.]
MSNVSKYNPKIHHRRSIRSKGYDYTRAGAYFITICCEGRICRFGDVVLNEMVLNEYGWIAYNEWMKLSERFSNFELDVFQIMPNHIHGIIVMVGATVAVAQNKNDETIVQKTVGATLTVAQNKNDETIVQKTVGATLAVAQNDGNTDIRAGASTAPTGVGDIVGTYKSLVANKCLKIFKLKNETMGKLWQRNYYECIIRNPRSYQNISNYIINNPVKWNDDKFFTAI